MSYLVLARKYRPQTFDQVCSQNHITSILSNTIKLNRIAHAYLFTGPRGVGKTSMARIFSKSLNCLQDGPTVTPCNECNNCQEITAGISADVIEIDGASNTGVDDIRELQRELMYSAANSRFKIYIIDEVHMLSKNAFNALLKTLEEPPENVVFIFATTEPHKVLATIISRCQRFDFKRIPVSGIVDQLKFIVGREKISIEEEALFLIAKKADGSMRDALSLLDQLLAFGKENLTYQDVLDIFGIVPADRYKQILEHILRKETSGVINMLHEILDKGNDLQEFLNGLLEYTRDLLLLRLEISRPDISKIQINDMKNLAGEFTDNDLLYLMSLLIRTKIEVKNSGNPLMVAEMSFVKLAKLHEIRSVETILGELEDQSRNIINPKADEQNTTKTLSPEDPLVKTEKIQAEISLEAEQVKPKFDKLDLEIMKTGHKILSEKVKKERPILMSYFRQSKPVNVVNNLIRYQIGSDLALKMLKDNRGLIESVISNHFGLKARVEFVLVKEEKKQTIANPSLDDIKKKSPQLAEFIETTDSIIS